MARGGAPLYPPPPGGFRAGSRARLAPRRGAPRPGGAPKTPKNQYGSVEKNFLPLFCPFFVARVARAARAARGGAPLYPPGGGFPRQVPRPLFQTLPVQLAKSLRNLIEKGLAKTP